MPVRLADVPMTANGRRRWRALSDDDRDLLSHVFHDAISRPERVGGFKPLASRMLCGKPFQSVRFRSGYAHFCIYVLGTRALLHDLWLDPIPE